MADMVLTTTTEVTNQIAKLWSKDLEHEAQTIQLWQNYVGSAIVTKEELLRQPGDTIYISKRALLTAGGGDLTDGTKLEGNEEQLSLSRVTFVPAEHGKAVALSKQAEEKVNFSLRKEAKDALSEWAGDKMDLTMWAASAIGTNVLYGGDATSTATLEATDLLTTTLISKAAAMLRMAKTKPLTDGFYHMLIDPQQAYDLQVDTNFNAANKDAGPRSDANKLFAGVNSAHFVGYWSGVAIYETGNVTMETNGGSVDCYKAIVFGLRAFGRALGRKWTWAEQETDYGREYGVATTNMHQDKILNDEYIVRIETAATDLS